jgi:hypothetical protein
VIALPAATALIDLCDLLDPKKVKRAELQNYMALRKEPS